MLQGSSIEEALFMIENDTTPVNFAYYLLFWLAAKLELGLNIDYTRCTWINMFVYDR